MISPEATALLEAYTKAISNLNSVLLCQNDIDAAFDAMAATRLELERFIASLELLDKLNDKGRSN